MSDYLNPALAELEDRIAVVWPDLVKDDDGKRLWRGEHVATLPLEALITAHGLPYAVLVASEEQPAGIDGEDRYGIVLCEVYYVTDNAGKANSLLTQGQALRDALWPDDPLSLSQVWTKPKVSVSLKLDGNRILRMKKDGLYSVAVSFALLTGEPSE